MTSRTAATLGLVIAGCGFSPTDPGAGSGSADGGRASIDAARDALVGSDAGSGGSGSAGGGSACGGAVWAADFSSDPTADGMWALRSGAAFPTSELADGVWSAPNGTAPLDTQPKQLFATRVVVDVRMRATSAIQSTSPQGAELFINVGYSAGSDTFSPVFTTVAQTQLGQIATVYTKDGSGDAVPLGAAFAFGSDFVDVHLDIDPVGHRVVANANHGADGSGDLGVLHGGSDQWASLATAGVDAQFDSVTVEVCP